MEWKTTHAWDYSDFPSTDIKVTSKSQAPVTYHIRLNDSEINLSAPVLNANGRVMYPFRECLESMGATVMWDAQSKTAMGTLGNHSVAYTIGANQYMVDGALKNMDDGVQAFVNDGRTYIPIRSAAEALGFTVAWDNDSNTVLITN